MKIRVVDHYTQQDVTIKYALAGATIDYYLEAFKVALLAVGFDQKIVDARIPQNE
jgi:hypothetical protein